MLKMNKFGFKINQFNFNKSSDLSNVCLEHPNLLKYSSDTDLINKNNQYNNGQYLFCYGSNSLSQLKQRLKKENLIVKKAYLPNYVRIFAGNSTKWNGGVASIIQANSYHQVKGCVVYVHDSDLFKLDKYEGAHKDDSPFSRTNNIYRRKYIKIFDENHNEISAITYIKNNQNWLYYPSTEYLQAVKKNVQEFWEELDEFGELLIYDNQLMLKGKYK